MFVKARWIRSLCVLAAVVAAVSLNEAKAEYKMTGSLLRNDNKVTVKAKVTWDASDDEIHWVVIRITDYNYTPAKVTYEAIDSSDWTYDGLTRTITVYTDNYTSYLSIGKYDIAILYYLAEGDSTPVATIQIGTVTID